MDPTYFRRPAQKNLALTHLPKLLPGHKTAVLNRSLLPVAFLVRIPVVGFGCQLTVLVIWVSPINARKHPLRNTNIVCFGVRFTMFSDRTAKSQ